MISDAFLFKRKACIFGEIISPLGSPRFEGAASDGIQRHSESETVSVSDSVQMVAGDEKYFPVAGRQHDLAVRTGSVELASSDGYYEAAKLVQRDVSME